MVHKMRTNEAQEIYRLRQIEPEPVFGNLKHNKGIRMFVTRGLEKVNGELQIMSMGLGIGKLAKYLSLPENRIKFNKDMASADDQRILFTAQYQFSFKH